MKLSPNIEQRANLPLLPQGLGDIETRAILKMLPKAHAALAELKGVASSMPNQSILVGTLSLQEAKDILAEQAFDICLTDMRLPDGNGIELIQHVAQHYQNMPIAMITAYGDVQSAVNALKSGAFDFVSKPVDLSELRDIIQRGLLLKNNTNVNSSTNNAATQALPEAL